MGYLARALGTAVVASTTAIAVNAYDAETNDANAIIIANNTTGVVAPNCPAGVFGTENLTTQTTNGRARFTSEANKLVDCSKFQAIGEGGIIPRLGRSYTFEALDIDGITVVPFVPVEWGTRLAFSQTAAPGTTYDLVGETIFGDLINFTADINPTGGLALTNLLDQGGFSDPLIRLTFSQDDATEFKDHVFGSWYDQADASTNANEFADALKAQCVFDKTDPRCVTNTVPEPGTLALFGAGLVGLGAIRRRRTTTTTTTKKGPALAL